MSNAIWVTKACTATRSLVNNIKIFCLGLFLSQSLWASDTTRPVIAITYSPPPIINWNSANFGFKATDVGSGIKQYKCSRNGSPFELCTSIKSYTDLAQGSHTFTFRAFDYADNTDDASYTLVVDTKEPIIVLNSKPASSISSTSASFSFTSTDNVGGSGIRVNMCKLDGAAAAPCGGSPKVYSGLPSGSHKFSIYALDNAGNQSLTTSYTFSVLPSPRGHYISFGGKPTNLKTQMTDILDNPQNYSNYEVSVATDIRDAILAEGVKGFWIPFDWDMVEREDNDFNWQFIEDNLAVAKRYNKRAIFKFSDRSFDGRDIMPDYFTSAYSIKVGSQISGELGGYTAKRWDPYVYKRIIRILRAIATRYDSHPHFAGLATTETSLGVFDNDVYNYSPAAYENALVEIFNQSKGAFVNSKLIMYINFITGGMSYDLSKDIRARIIDRIMATPSPSFVLGGPDVKPDYRDHANSVNLLYIWAEKKYPSMLKACHAQYDDYAHRKSNQYRIAYFDVTGFYPQDILRPRYDATKDLDLHPSSEIGIYWTPFETFRYGRENFGCNFFFWHYKTKLGVPDVSGAYEYTTQDVLPVIKSYPNL